MTNPNITTLSGLQIKASAKNKPFQDLIEAGLTTEQMNALTPMPGAVVYNKQTNNFMGYVGGENSGWKNFTVQ